MSDVLDNIRKQITELRDQLAELETAQRVILRMNHVVPAKVRVAPKPAKESKIVKKHEQNGEFASLTVVQAAQRVLAEAGKPLHYAEVFHGAVSRGYRSGRKGDGKADSFVVLMRRNPDIFKAEGEGIFSLKEKD